MKQTSSKKILFSILAIALLASLYGMRVSYVNRNNGKTKVHYVTDNGPAKTNVFEIRVSRETLYETAAFVDAFPLARKCFTYQGSIHEQMHDLEALQGIKYVLYVELEFMNITDEMQDIDLINYSIFMNDSFHDGVDPFLLQELNQASGISLRPGHSYTVKMAYSLHRGNIAPERYQNLLRQNFSLMLTGYPYIQKLRLTHITSVKADKEAVALLQNLTAPKKAKVPSLPNTKEGTITDLGGYYVDNGVKVQVDSVSFADKNIPALLKEIGEEENAAGGEKNTLEKYFIDKNGNATHYLYPEVDTDYQLVVVTLNLKNDTDVPATIYLSPYLNNHTGNENYESIYTHIENLQHALYSSNYIVDAYSQGTMTLIYPTGEKEGKPKIWDVKNKPLYLGFHNMAVENVNLDKGICKDGKFLRIQ